MRNLAFVQPEIYDTAYDVADRQSLAREEAREQIINELLAVAVTRINNKSILTLEDALFEYLVIPESKIDAFIEYQVEL